MIENYSYIPSYNRGDISRAVDSINNQLQVKRSFFAAHGEGFEDWLGYLQKGADWKSRAIIAEVEDYCNKSKMPMIMRPRYIAQAEADLDLDLLQYESEIAENLRLSLPTGCLSVDVTKDVTPHADAWTISEDWIKRYKEKLTITLTPAEIEDMKSIQRGVDVIQSFGDLGYCVASICDYIKAQRGKAVITAEDVRSTFKTPNIPPEFLAAMQGK